MQGDESNYRDEGDAPNKESAAGELVPETPEPLKAREEPKGLEPPAERRGASIHHIHSRKPTADPALQPYNQYVEGRDDTALKIRRYRDLQNRRRERTEARRNSSEYALHEATRTLVECRRQVARRIVSMRRRLHGRIDSLRAERIADASALMQAQQGYETLQRDVAWMLALMAGQLAGLRVQAALVVRKLRGVVRTERVEQTEMARRLERLQKQVVYYQSALAGCLLGYVALVLFF